MLGTVIRMIPDIIFASLVIAIALHFDSTPYAGEALAIAIRGIVLDSSLIQFPQNAPEEAAAQEKWLVEQLQVARKGGVKHLFVFQHISYFLQEADEPDQYFN